MAGILERIIVYKRDEIAAAKVEHPLLALEAAARAADPPRGFRAALAAEIAAGRFGLIAEIKKASPSRGLIRADFDPPTLARAYQAGGAACLSVLTDVPSFEGAPDDLMSARRATHRPVLRKDFMIDPYQVTEARAWGADCILVILAAVDDKLAGDLMAAAGEWGMDALIEVHDETERDRALGLAARLIGINNRDLKTFETRLETTECLVRDMPEDPLVISESGIVRHEDLQRLAGAGVRAFLVGESLMRRQNVRAATRALLTGQSAATQTSREASGCRTRD